MERILYDQICDYFDQQNLFSKHPFGFRPYHSTTTTQLDCTNEWYANMDRGLYNLVVFLFLSNSILVFHMVTNFQPSSSSKQFVGTGGNDPCHVNFGFTSTLSRLLQNELTFLLSLILLFYIVPNFQPSSSSKQVVGTGGNQTCHLNLKHFGLTCTPPGLLLKTASFLSYLILVFHIVTNFQPSSGSKIFVGTGGNDPCHVNFKHFGFTSTLPRLLQKKLPFLLSLILAFYIVPNFQPSSNSKQFFGTGGNRSLSLKLETL